MARCDYYGIETELQEILQADSLLQGSNVVVEEELMFVDNSPMIGIYIERRDPAPNQRMAAGTVQRYRVTFSIWIFTFAQELAAAIRQRDDLLGKLEVVLLGNRTINGKVDMSFIEGGDMMPAIRPENVGVVVGGETRLIAEVTFDNS